MDLLNASQKAVRLVSYYYYVVPLYQYVEFTRTAFVVPCSKYK